MTASIASNAPADIKTAEADSALEIQSDVEKTPLYDLHLEAKARMVEFAGYLMPVQYSHGIKAEHLHTRSAAGLFDVSHMGQILVEGGNAIAELEVLMPVDLEALALNHLCYTQLTNQQGGIIDDLIITRRGEEVFLLVVNAGCKQADIVYLQNQLTSSNLEYLDQQALLALQGPAACKSLSDIFPEAADILSSLAFMQGASIDLLGCECFISRSGYTGEDGFELSVPAKHVAIIAQALLSHYEVEWIGLGARDSLRLEAGLCLYGHDINSDTTPIESGLRWSVSPSRRSGAKKQGGFVGDKIILKQMQEGCLRKRVGFVVDGRVPVREGADLVSSNGQLVGRVSSGGFSPTLAKPIAMAYAEKTFIESGEKCFALVRGNPQPLTQCKMPFVPHQYIRI